MRATRFVATILASTLDLCLASLIAGQANWTPNPADQQSHAPANQPSALWGISVGMVTLTPAEARERYNIEIGEKQKFVMVKRIDSKGRAAGGRSNVTAGDIVDTVILGGEIPNHGEVKSLSDWDRFVSLCKPGCLLLVRHRGYRMSSLTSLGPIETKFVVSHGGKTIAGESVLYSPWWGICDKQSGYLFNLTHESDTDNYDNWISPEDFTKRYGVASCETSIYPPSVAETGGSAPVVSPPQRSDPIQEEIGRIRNAPHEAMPPSQSTGAALGGQTSMTVENGTPYSLSVYLAGPVSQKLEIAAGQSQTVRLSPGHYEVAAKVSDPSVIPFYGTEEYGSNMGYSSHFYIATQPR